MTRPEIRLQYSGFVVFIAKLISVASGLIFQLMIARATTIPEFDIWFNLSDILAYFTLLAAAIPFWSMRFTARNKLGAVKTGIVANLIISVIAAAIYIPLAPLITSSLGIPSEYLILYLLLVLQIIELYAINALQASLQARIPHAVGYGFLITEGCRVILGYILIIQLKQPLAGALISLAVSYAVQTVYYLILLRDDMKQPVQWKYFKEWIKGSLANIYRVLGGQIVNFAFIMLFAYGGDGARGRFGIAKQVANVITYSSFLAYALHPKLLSDRKGEDITTSLKMVLMFAIPMTAGAIALSESYIVIMKSVYRDAVPILIVVALDMFILTISTLFSFVLFGMENVDEESRISFKDLVKSRLFIFVSLPYIHSAITLPITYFVLTNYAMNQALTSALYVSIINAVARFVSFIILCLVVRKMVSIQFPWKNVTKYVFASLVMTIVLVLLPQPTRIIFTVITTGIGGLVYLILLIMIDEETRLLVRSILNEFRSRIGFSST